jgi:phosphatidate phosphatase PAH1
MRNGVCTLTLFVLVGCMPVVQAQGGKCPPPLPTNEGSSFKHMRTKLVTAMGDARHRGQDVLVVVGQPQRVAAKFAYGQLDKDLKDEAVDIYVQREVPCGEWSLLGQAWTTKDGDKRTVDGVEDDGGRVFFDIPEERRLPAGRHPIRMRVRGDGTVAAFELVVVPPETKVVVFDIDGTLTTRDKEITKEYLAELVNIDYDPAMYEGAVEVVKAWADNGYTIAYVTGRPDWLRKFSEKWLKAKGFPPGVLHLAETMHQVLPTSGGVAKYKADYLKSLQERGLFIAAAYGNATTDIEAFAEAAVAKSSTYIIGPHGGEEGTVAVGGYREHVKGLVVP